MDQNDQFVRNGVPDPSWPHGNKSPSTGTTTSLPIPGSGNNTQSNTTSTGNGSTITSTGGASPWFFSNTTTIATPRKVVKDKIAYVIVKTDGTQLILSEQSVLTAQEMIGITKFLSVVSATTNAVSAALSQGYNLQINWSQVIKDLAIERHFVTWTGTPGAATNVFEILLYDPT
jgi:hypothetical protein